MSATDAASAMQEAERPPASSLALLIGWSPLIALVFFMVWYLKKTGVGRNREHMDRVEKQGAEIVEILKRIEARLNER
ncbi:MAG: hypothetical protein U0X73_17460 [Thermoanaerobaculia bacterium]